MSRSVQRAWIPGQASRWKRCDRIVWSLSSNFLAWNLLQICRNESIGLFELWTYEHIKDTILNNNKIPHFEARLAEQLPLGYDSSLHRVEYVVEEYPLLIWLNLLEKRYLFKDWECPLLHRINILWTQNKLLELSLELRDFSNQPLIILDRQAGQGAVVSGYSRSCPWTFVDYSNLTKMISLFKGTKGYIRILDGILKY